MRTHPWLLIGGSIGVLATAVTIGQWTRWGVVALVAMAVLGWLLTFRCTHRYATLLPPVRDGGPDRDHARWYCDRCGKTWDSGLASSTRPRVIYSGHDEQKAVLAAARADSLDKQRRRIATKRTSGAKRTSRPAPASRPGPRPVEAVLEQRAVGFDDHESARPFAAVRRS
jgi:transposase-like protein